MPNSRPRANSNSRICLNFSVDGLNVYANRQALSDLRDQLTCLIESPPEDFYHCHVLMSLANGEEGIPKNAGVVFTQDAAKMVEADIEGGECVDLTFVAMTDAEMDDVQRQQR